MPSTIPYLDEVLARDIAVSNVEGNDLAQTEFAQDMLTMPDFLVEEKYGPQAVEQRRLVDQARNQDARIQNSEQSVPQFVGDAVLSAGAGGVGVIGSIGAAGLGLAGEAIQAVDPEYTGVSEYAAQVAETTEDISANIKSHQSQALQDQQSRNAVESALDASDSYDQSIRELIAGESPTIVAARRVGRNVLNEGGRVISSAGLAGDTIASALGSLGPTAKLASGASKIVTGSRAYNAAHIANAIAPTTSTALIARGAEAVKNVAIASSIGLSEASGSYSGAVSSVQTMTHAELMAGSSDYKDLIEQGVNPDQAKAVVASDIGVDAFLRQFPVAAATGLLVSRFESAPIQNFRGATLMDNLRTIGTQTLEEGVQEGTSSLNTNLAVQAVNPNQEALEGVGEGIALGAIGGAGMAGGLAAPSTIASIGRGTVDAARSDTASSIIGSAVDAGSAVASRVADVAEPVVAPVVQRVQEAADPVNKDLQEEVLGAAREAMQAVVNEAPEIQAPVEAAIPVLNNIAAERVSRWDDANILQSATIIKDLQNSIGSLPEAARTHVQKMMESADFKTIQTRAAEIDLNQTQTTETEVTPETTQTTLNVARIKPENVNPEHVNKILEQRDRTDLTEEDIRILTVASEIATAVNNHQGQQVEISTEKSIALSKKPAYNGKPAPKITPLESTSRSIQVGGFKDASGKELRSVNDFAADILQGVQSENQSLVNADGFVVPVEGVINQFRMFAQHMTNKVDAFNRSFQQSDENGKGPTLQFESLVGGEKLVPAGGKGGAKGVFYHQSSPKSVELAQTVANDARITVEVYNSLAKAFPEQFPEGPISVPELLTSGSQADLSTETDTQERLPFEDADTPVEVAPDAEPTVEFVDPQITDEVSETEETPTAVEEDAVSETQASDEQPTQETTEIEETQTEPEAELNAENTLIGPDGEPVRLYHGTNKAFDEFTDGEIFLTSDKGLALSHATRGGLKGARVIEATVALENPLEIEIESNDLPDSYYLHNTISIESDAKKGNHDGIMIWNPEGDLMVIARRNDQVTQISPETKEQAQVAKEEKREALVQEQETKTPVTQKFADTFIENDEQVDYTNGQELLNKVPETETSYLEFAQKVIQPLMDGMNQRLKDVVFSKEEGVSVFDKIKAGEDLTNIRDYKSTMFVDPTTGEYDPDLLSIAAVATVDWLSSVRSADPSMLQDTLEELGLDYSDLDEGEIYKITYGVSPRQASEGLAKNIIRLWNMRPNQDSQMVDIRGASEGLVKEILTVLAGQFDFIKFEDIPTIVDGKRVTAKTINVKDLQPIQQEIGLTGQNSIQKVVAPEDASMPSIGQKIDHTDITQTRGDVPLSDLEKAALKRMQDTPHTLAQGIDSLASAMGFDVISRMLGFKSVDHLAEGHPLRNSIEGKNLSIQRDWQDAQMVSAALDTDTPVYYPVGISKVGRHQFKGINPQNNKILRALVTPTHSVLDMTDKADADVFWLTVAQASGIFKVENQNHNHILSNIQEVFTDKFGDAVSIVEDYIRTGELNAEALLAATGTIEMAQLNAIFAVADMNMAADKTQFQTSLSFELDGKTDGPANMMSNFGQGILTQNDLTNFQRVGFFLGSKFKTLNKFFGDGLTGDLYEATSKRAQRNLFSNMAEASPGAKETLRASARFAAIFGDFRITDSQTIEMTRNTAKNPMTKTVYGSGVKGVGEGIAQDMLLTFYEKILTVENNQDPAEAFGYPDFHKDFETLFGDTFPANANWAETIIQKKNVAWFNNIVVKSIGQVLSDAAKSEIGAPITQVNDTLVFLTGVQTEFLSNLFQQRLEALAEKRAEEGKIGRNAKGKPIVRQLSKRDYDGLVRELRQYAPLYSNGAQTLAVGSFSGQVSNIELSSTMDGKLRQDSTLDAPDIAGVKIIPYISIGRGDAMMMNTIYGSDMAPNDTLPVFDGIDMPINKIKEYADQINGAVMQNWDRDVLGDIVADFENFLSSVEDQDMLRAAFNTIADKSPKSTVKATNAQGLLDAVKEARRQNQARKQAFREVPLSVDHMGGSDTAYTRGPDGEMDLDEINTIIRQKLTEEEVSVEPVDIETTVETDSDTLVTSLVKQTRNKSVRDTARVLKKILTSNFKVVLTKDADRKGTYDTQTRVLTLSTDNHETITHELIHAATFDVLHEHYKEGAENNTVSRLETLMAEFMEIDFSGSSQQVRDAVNSARSQILGYQNNSDPFNQAAALNEFMAWSLSNDALIKELKQRETSVVKRLTKTVKALMQRLLGGIPSDMYSNILFNTEILNQGPIVEDSGNGDGGNNNNNDDGEITPPAHEYTNFWINLVRERIEGLQTGSDRQARTQQMIRYRDAAVGAVQALDFGGFTLSEYQKQTFKAIHMVMATEMRLDVASAEALNKTYRYVTDNLTPEMFGPNNAQDRYSAVMELLGNTKNDEGVSDAIAVLLALSQTSKGFRRALDQLPTPESAGVDTASLNDFLTTVTGMLMSKAVGSIDTADKSAKDVLDALSENLIREESDKEYSMLRGLMASIDKADSFVSGAMSKLAERADDFDRQMTDEDRNKLTKTIAHSVAFATAFMDKDRSEIAAGMLKDVTHMGISLTSLVPVQEFVSEIVGTDKNNAEVMALLDRTNHAISQVRQDFREALPVIFQNAFSKHPDAAQWKTMHKVLGKADFSTLFRIGSPATAFRLFSDNSFLTDRVNRKEQVIRANFPSDVADIIIEKSQQLAGFMLGKGPGFQLWKNAYSINKHAGDYNESMTKEIDVLVSLYAAESISAEEKAIINEAHEQDPQAMYNLMTYMQALNKEEDLKIVSETAKLNGYKGYIPDHGTGNATVVIRDNADRAQLEKMGFTYVGEYTAETGISVVSRGYYTTTVKQGGQYSQGVMQSVHDTYRGVDATTGLTVTGGVSGVISGEGVAVATDALNSRLRVADNKEALIPVFDDDGILFYERGINPDIKEKYTQPRSNLALMIGSWAGRQVEEKFAHKYNSELITELKRLWDERAPGSDDLFVDISSRTLKDPIYRDSWNIVSKQTKAQIEDVFGEGNGFMVRKDMINQALGYREPSIVDVWTGKTRMPNAVNTAVKAVASITMGNKAVTYLSRTEEGVQSVVSQAKDVIVVRSLVVPYMNTQANVFQLQTRGVAIKQMVKGYREKTAELEQYNENIKTLLELRTRMLLAGADKNQVAIIRQQMQVLEDQNARMTIAPLIDAGAYKNISEGITDLDVELTSGRMGEWVENQLNKLPAGVQTVAKYGLLSKDTALYKGANRAVQYGDFLAKSIMYDHLVNQGLDQTEALKKVNEEFVNFTFLPGRTRSYLESLGGTWFLSFKIRIMKIAMKMLRDNPVRSLLTASTVGDLGSPVADNLASVIAQDRLDYALGWDMLFGSPELNPWVNMSDW